ncbi:T-complex protein 11-domain-containing protein [Neohortaea acidophila]|uniref:T-complex protein 11-domain-containing protein n=1 Tax=Neohortaea acidophila TaxID=245834 RepID=A0A6A6PIU5_9PEZI|nr:T-complex protein 11-domain-containing protein [Neohortaea acidophila]KAF2479960.1 T-complex protein 11-domain-containing protein [Neohortaea acidophila]
MGVPNADTEPLPSPHGDEGAAFPPPDTTNPTDPLIDADENSDMFDAPQDPPPHLIARFYRNRPSARRKSSATSSRRNSLSSVHSRSSSVQSRRHGSLSGCQSNYIAQHLRRASIIESRRARLADRAAHAEQVRLRAALAKAAPRGSITNSEERALAAQLAKEKYLAKVAAACAEEVARAKRIAEEVKERKLAEEVRARLEMEERHAEVERRRAEYQRNLQARRARRADSAEKKLGTVEEVADVDEEAVDDRTGLKGSLKAKQLSEVEAARRIRRAWTLYRRQKTVAAYTQLNLLHRSSHDTFEDMTKLVADESTISATTGVLMLLGLQDNDDTAALNTRTFLSAFMITGHPVAVMNTTKGAQEQDLIQKATDLITNYEACVSRLARWNHFTPNATQLEQLSQAYSAYTSTFAAWRLQDSSVLIEGMVDSFVELDAIWQTVKDDSRGEVASDYREGIRDNQVMLLSRIRKLAGPDRADFLIKKAIRESRRKRPKKRPAAEVRPRVLESVQPESSVAAQPSLDSDDESAVDEVSPAALVPAYPPSNEELADLFTAMPSNRVLTHELAIDKEYRLEDSQSDLRDQLYRSICENMKRAFEAGDGVLWTVSAAENIREKLLRMLTPGNSMHTLISDTLDLESIRRQCRQGVFSYTGFFEFMGSVLPKLCAPYRDAEMKALTDELNAGENGLDEMTGKLFKILRMVDKLSLDYTNFMIMNASATLIREAPGYEQRMFAKDLEAGVITLAKTEQLWRTAYAQLALQADRRDPEGVRNASDRPSAQKVYAHVLLTLATEHGELQPDLVPETLMLDLRRLQNMRQQALRITVIGAILLTAKNLLKRDSRSLWKNEASRLWHLLSNEPYALPSNADNTTTTPAQKAFSILETAHNMPPATKHQLSGTIARFFAQAAGARLTDPVLKVLSQRLRTHVATRLSASTSSERVRAASSASEALASCGMPEFTAQVGGIVEVLGRVGEVDWRGHGGWYEGVYEKVIEERV